MVGSDDLASGVSYLKANGIAHIEPSNVLLYHDSNLNYFTAKIADFRLAVGT